MVHLTSLLLTISKGKSHLGRVRHSFIDQVRVYARGGGGGQGHPKFGGIGGEGGDIYVQAVDGVTLKNVKSAKQRQRYIAGTGDNSKSRVLQGTKGRDILIKVPVGVCVTNDKNRVLGDLNNVGDKVLVAKGGEGGNQSNEWSGAKGKRGNFKLILKLIADVGFVGFPNAGKSTLLKAISRTVPKIADYPFTTIRPQVGVVEFADKRQISMADLPGLIEGSHLNRGMGHKFLRHVERTKLLLFVVDVHGFQLTPRHSFRTAHETIHLLNKELELYRHELVQKPAILALNKIDLDGSEERLGVTEELLRADQVDSLDAERLTLPARGVDDADPLEQVMSGPIRFEDVIPISAKQGTGLDRLCQRVREVIDEHYDQQRTEMKEEEEDCVTMSTSRASR